MIFKYLYSLPNSTTGDGFTVQVASVVGGFTPFFLAFVFFTVWLGGIGLQKARRGDADYPLWSVIASISTLMVSLVLSTVTGVIQLDWLVIVLVVTIFSGVWLFLDKRGSEV